MRVAVMQPYIFPYIGYFQLIKAVNKFVILDDVSYMKKGWVNRNNILAQGALSSQMFTIPLKSVSQNKRINEIEISLTGNWSKNFIEKVRHSYSHAPYFEETYKVIIKILESEINSLSSFLLNSLIILKDYLGLNTEFVNSSSVYNNSYLKGEERIIDICKREGAEIYVNAIGGLELYNREHFKTEGLELFFLKPGEIEYKQFKNDFIPNLSIIDVLMFNNKDTISGYLEKYELV